MANVNVSTGFLGWLTILFIGLKLTGFITWSWWWVLAPVWIPFATFVPIFVIAALTAVIVALKS